MQVTCIEDCHFIGSRMFEGKGDIARNYYVVNIADETGEVIKFFTPAEVYDRTKILQFGDKCSCTLEVRQGRTAPMVTLTDVRAI